MKTWANQLIETKNLFGFLISFKKEDVNIKYGVFEDSIIPTLINL